MKRADLGWLLAMGCGLACAQNTPDYLAELSPYVAPAAVAAMAGPIRVWGNPYIPELVQAWQQGFRRQHPQAEFQTRLKGTEAAMAGLYGGIADVVFIGREAYRAELQAFEEWFGYPPTCVKITSGSYATPHKTFALMVYVHKDNPLASISLMQLDAIYGVERRRGAPVALRTWGDLGLTGPWAARPIHVLGYNFDTGMAGFFRLTVLRDSLRWNPELKDFDNGRTPAGEVINAGQYILNAVANDPLAIAYANVQFENASVKRLALSEDMAQAPVEASIENAWRRRYPLARYSVACINRPPGQPVEPRLREFLRYILSRDGMAAVVTDGAFLPLDATGVERERRALD